MKVRGIHIGNLFFLTSVSMLILGLAFGILSAITYVAPDFLKESLGFVSLRPLHVSSAIFWIILGATGCVYSGVKNVANTDPSNPASFVQWLLWIIAIGAILFSYFRKDFGGREYWEFNPVWALPILLAWVIFLFNYISIVRKVKEWPVYMWMWFTGIVFFLFTFVENYLWLFPYFREHFITDTTIQWKVNGSLVGSWNQLLYGTAFFLMDKIAGNRSTGRNKVAFAMYFLGLFNLMFNWGHHIYTLPTEKHVKYIGYAVSMTEWIFFARIVYDWRKTLTAIRAGHPGMPYRFLMAADIWVFLNMAQAIAMSIPFINRFTHGTHITVAHAMGTTIGINSMILLAACFEFAHARVMEFDRRWLKISFWTFQFSLLLFWLSLNAMGIMKGYWQLSMHRESYSSMMLSLRPMFFVFISAGCGLFLSLGYFVTLLVKIFSKQIIYSYKIITHEKYS
jgi:nitric oxide reductase subunit B